MTSTSPCVEWATQTDLMDTCDLTAIHPDTLTSAFTFASDVLYNLTRRRWPGLCTDTFRPFVNCCCWATTCDDPNVQYHAAIKLPATDVRAITQVKVDGAVIAASDYRLRGNYLFAARRADGTVRGWPCWNDLLAADTAVDTFSVAYTHGADPPASMRRAAAMLAFEFAKGWTPSCAGDCRLPSRITTISRAGTTFAIIDPLTMFKDGLIGIPDIDVLIQAVNHGDNHRRSFVGRAGSPRVSR